MVILASSVLMGPILCVFINRLQPLARRGRRKGEEEEEREEVGEPLSMKMCYWFVYGALLKQGFTKDPKSGEALTCSGIFHIYVLIASSMNGVLFRPNIFVSGLHCQIGFIGCPEMALFSSD